MKKINKNGLTALVLAGTVAMSPVMALAATFSDVPSTHWAYSHIEKLTNLNIVKGYPDGTFLPDGSLTFLEVMSLLQGFSGYNTAQTKAAVATKGYIADEYGVPEWARDDISVALDVGYLTELNLKQASLEGLVHNGAQDAPRPDRQTIAVYVARALDIQPDKDHSVLKYKDLADIGIVNDPKVGDVNVLDILSGLVKAGILSDTGSDGNFEPKRELQRDEITKILDKAYEYLDQKKNTVTMEGTVLQVLELQGNKVLTFTDKDDETQAVNLNAGTVVTRGEKTLKVEDLTPGLKIKVEAYGSKNTQYVATKVDIQSETLTGKGFVWAVDKDAQKLTIDYITKGEVDFYAEDFEKEAQKELTLGKDVKAQRFGKEIELKDINKFDYVEFEAVDDVLTEINVYPKEFVEVGKVKNITSSFNNAEAEVVIGEKTYTVAMDKNADTAKLLKRVLDEIKNDPDWKLVFHYKDLKDITKNVVEVEGTVQGYVTRYEVVLPSGNEENYKIKATLALGKSTAEVVLDKDTEYVFKGEGIFKDAKNPTLEEIKSKLDAMIAENKKENYSILEVDTKNGVATKVLEKYSEVQVYKGTGEVKKSYFSDYTIEAVKPIAFKATFVSDQNFEQRFQDFTAFVENEDGNNKLVGLIIDGTLVQLNNNPEIKE
ncbi:MAG: S-layer homology domain-containing protein [Tissierellia bacterium]|nr:S-layer homology domain-containing protein [Tissierellia bacterium]